MGCTSLSRGKCILFFVYLHIFGIKHYISLFFACHFKSFSYICSKISFRRELSSRYEVRGSLFIYSQKNLNNMQKRLQLLLALLAFVVTSAMAQITTSGISGKISSNGETVIGATVTATHQPSGTVYRAVTNVDGRYTIQGMRPGGPYKVSISYIGYKDKVFNNVSLSLGETENISCSLQEDAHQLQEVVVSGKAGLAASRTGAATSMTAEQINNMPSITHGIADVARLNPQLTVTNSGNMSFAGTNNRYNNFMIDGAANNDVFGLASSGNNGGQAGAQPVSMETIEQIQVSVAPFDVRQSGFTGGAINAITKSGTNKFHGSAYYYGYNQDLIGTKYPYLDGTGYAPKYQKQTQYNMGVTLGGPIIKNKLFFFANYERTNKEYPNLYGVDSGNSKVNTEQAKDIMNMLQKMAEKQGCLSMITSATRISTPRAIRRA